MATGTGGQGVSAASSRPSLFIPSCGNLSVAYNMTAASVAVAIMTASHGVPVTKQNGGSSDIPEPEWAQKALLGVAFAGAMAGMLLFGIVGDKCGRRRGMIATLSLVVFGALGSAFFTWGPEDVFCTCRRALIKEIPCKEVPLMSYLRVRLPAARRTLLLSTTTLPADAINALLTFYRPHLSRNCRGDADVFENLPWYWCGRHL